MSVPVIFLSALLSFDAERPAPNEYRAGVESIQTREIRAWLEFLASPELEGRDTGSRGYDTASRYVASQLQGFGVEPGGVGGSFYHAFTMVKRERLTKEAFVLLTAADTEAERIPLDRSVGVQAQGTIHWKGPWVCVGHGEGAAADARDDFRGLLKDDSVAFVVPRKGEEDQATRGVRAAGGRRVVVVSDRHVRRRTGLRFGYKAQYRIDEEPRDPDGVEIVYISTEVADRILARWSTSVEKIRAGTSWKSRAVDGVHIEVKIEMRRTEDRTQNVVGRISGSDPALAEEVVVLGAHLDHVGRRDDKIYYGADDDGSGCVAMLAAARAYCLNGHRPRRSVVMIFFGAEERGLHGSRAWVDRPTVPLENVVAMFNLDMVGRDEQHAERKNRDGKIVRAAEAAADNVNTLHVVGSKRHSLELDPWIHRVNESIGFEFEYDEEGVWRRSDHFNFAAKGIPVAFFFAGFHPDYHQPTDTPEKINWDKLTKVARLVFSITYEIADRPRRLRVNRL